MKRLFILLLLFTTTYQCVRAQRYFNLSGKVTDSTGQSISGANIRLRNDNFGTATDDQGLFKLKLEEGYYEISISAVGYTNQTFKSPINKDLTVIFVLIEKQISLKEISVTKKRYDPSFDIIQNVIENRKTLNRGLINYKCFGYIKASDKLIVDTTRKTNRGKAISNQPLNIDSIELELKNVTPSIPEMNFAEVDFTKYWGAPHNIKEERLGVRVLGEKKALYFISITEGEFDFYKNQVDLGKISSVKFISPFSPGANVSYKYKFIESYYVGQRKIYRIKIIPRKIGNALFEGEVEIYDSIWVIKQVDLSVNPNPLIRYNSFRIKQNYVIANDGFVYIESQKFTYTKSAKNGHRKGETSVNYFDYSPNLILPNRFFGNEVSYVFDSAYERDAIWWDSNRRDSLSKSEATFVRYSDSLQSIRMSKGYLDSIDGVYNKLTFLKLFWWGQGHVNREKKLRINYAPIISMLQPGSIGGFRVGYYATINKKFENRQSIRLNPYAHYGFINNDLKGSIFFTHLYDPVKRQRYYVYAAREFMMVNPFEAYINMFRRSNYFDQSRLQLGHEFEVVNGMYFNTYITFSDRHDLSKYKFWPYADSIFKTNNIPIVFNPHKSVEMRFTLSYTPKQQYIREPKEKIILGSKYPTFSIVYNQGVKGLLKSGVDFTYLQASINQSINLGRIGIGKYSISTGKFFDTTILPIVDYKYQRRGDPFLLRNPLGSFQLLPTTFPTFNWFLEAHYWHDFNGFLTSGVPLLKKLAINASAGSSLLYTYENNVKHIEVCYGINRVFRLLRSTIKIGVYYANGYNNNGNFYQGFKFSLENYNVRDNSWAF